MLIKFAHAWEKEAFTPSHIISEFTVENQNGNLSEGEPRYINRRVCFIPVTDDRFKTQGKLVKMSNGVDDYIENMGRPDWPGPVSLDRFLYPEPDRDIDVYLVVMRGRSTRGKIMQPHDQHWKFQWPLGRTRTGATPVYRQLEIVQEKNLKGIGDLNNLTNWGAITVPVGSLTLTNGIYFSLKKMSLSQREEFETICNTTHVKKPDGLWNCQDWCKTVLQTAIDKGLLTTADVNSTVGAAQEVEPVPYIG